MKMTNTYTIAASANYTPTQLKMETFKLQIQLCRNNNEALVKLKNESLTNPLLRATYVLQTTKSYVSATLSSSLLTLSNVNDIYRRAKDNTRLAPELKEIFSYLFTKKKG